MHTQKLENFSALQSILAKLRFYGGLAWMVGLNVEKSCVFKFRRRRVDGTTNDLRIEFDTLKYLLEEQFARRLKSL